MLLNIELDNGISIRPRFGEDTEVGFDPADNKVKVYSQGNKFGLGVFLDLEIEYDNAPVVGTNEELRQLIVADFTRDGQPDIALLVRTESGGFELRFYDNTGQLSWSDGRTVEIEPGIEINNVRVQLAAIDPANRMTDLIVFVDSQSNGGSQSDFFSMQNPGNGVFQAPVFAASGNSCDPEPFFAVTDMNRDGNDDIVCSAGGTLRVSEGINDLNGYFFSLFTTFQLLQSTLFAGLVARAGGNVALGTDTHFVQLQSTLAITFTAVAGLARQTPTPPPIQGKVEVADATGLIRVIVTATHENGDQLSTQTHDEDINGDGILDASELNLYSFTPTASGVYTITVDADNSVDATHTVTLAPSEIVVDTNQCTVQSPCENLDFVVINADTDFGDAPDSYGTAEHLIDSTFLGITVDGELAGIGSPGADSDDKIGRDDEDGVAFGAELIPGNPASFMVFANGFSELSVFIDFNADGDFSDSGEALPRESLEAGENLILFDVPPEAVSGQTYARFRVFDDDEDDFVGPTGIANSGEVEDVVVTIANTTDEPIFGLLGIESTASLVRSVDTSTTSSVSVDVIGSGNLFGWIDLNGDGDWLDPGEQIVNGAAVNEGSNFLSFSISPGTTSGDIAARFIVAAENDVQPADAGTTGDFLDLFFAILSGVDTPDVSVNTVDGSTLIQQGSIVVRSSAIELFRAKIAEIGSLSVVGTATDETVTINIATGFAIPSGGLSVDGIGGTDSLVLIGEKGTLDLTDPLIAVTNVGHLDLSSSDVNTIAFDAAAVGELSPTDRLVSIVTGEDDVIDVRDASDWRMTEPIRNGSFIVTADNSVSGGGEAIEAQVPHPWQNILRAGDVNNSGTVTALDALQIINELGRREFSSAGTSVLADPSSLGTWPGVYFDHNGDDLVTAADANHVINDLNLQGNSGSALGEDVGTIDSSLDLRRSANLQDDDSSAPDVVQRLQNGPPLKSASFEFIVNRVEAETVAESDQPATEMSSESLDELMSVDSFIDQLSSQSLLNSMSLAK